MSPRVPRSGELLALAGGVLIVVSAFLSHYRGAEGRSLSGWHVFGACTVLELLAAVAALTLLGFTVAKRGPALPVAAAVWSTSFGFIAVVAAVIRLFERPDHASALHVGTPLTLLGALLVLSGGWQSMRDERTELYRPATPAPRPAPPPGAPSA